MNELLNQVIERIEAANPLNGKKLRKRLSGMDRDYFAAAEKYYTSYDAALKLEGKSIAFGVECYLRMCNDMMEERLNFLRTGRYANSSYKEVEQRIYHNPEVMDYHMHGLAMAQFLWLDQYERLNYFRRNLPGYRNKIRSHLEIGGGHGLYTKEALTLLNADVKMDLLDISGSSLKLARQMIGPSRVNYTLKDVFDYGAENKYDFVTIAEVIEHVEKPKAMLERVRQLLDGDGAAFLTTPINAPMIDHIHLFNNVGEIRDLIFSSGFRITKDLYVISEDMPEEQAMKQKIPVMYAAFLAA